VKVLIRSPHHAAEIATAVRAILGVEPVVIEDATTCACEIADADALLCQPSQITPGIVEAMEHSRSLRWLQVLGSGTDKLASLRHRTDLVITNAADAYGDAVAEHALTLALALIRRIPEMMDAQAGRRWLKADIDGRLDSLEGSRAAVVGFGAIGKALTRRLEALGADVLAVRRHPDQPPPEGFAHVPFLPLADALPLADTLFLAVPLTSETCGLIDEESLCLLPRGARLINVSRGDVIATDALIAALETGALAGAALDVFPTEPPDPRSPLWSAPNLIISPHVAGRGNRMVSARMLDICERNLTAFAHSEKRQDR